MAAQAQPVSHRRRFLIGSAVAQPAAIIAVVEAIAPVFGLQRYARWVRLASIAFAVTRIARKWRQSTID